MNNFLITFSLWRMLNANNQRKAIFLMVIIIGVALFDSFSIFAVYLFIEYIFVNQGLGELAFDLGDHTYRIPNSLSVYIFLCIAIAPLIRYLAQAYVINYGQILSNELSIKLYRQYVTAGLASTTSLTTSDLNAAILSKTNMVTHAAIMPLVQLVGNVTAMIAIFSSLVIINWQVTIAAAIGMGLIFLVIYMIKIKSMRQASSIINDSLDNCSRLIEDGLQAKRYVLNNFLQGKYISNFGIHDRRMRIELALLGRLTILPRYALEAGALVGFILFVQFAPFQLNTVLPIVGTLAMAAQRFLPLAQQAFGAITSINGSADVVKSLYDSLSDVPNRVVLGSDVDSDITKIEKIETCELAIGYNGRIISHIPNMKLELGDIVAVTGISGAGKSTFLDTIAGFIPAISGCVKINNQVSSAKTVNKLWQSLTYIAQENNLPDSSIHDAVNYHCTGNSVHFSYDKERYLNSLKTSNSLEFVTELAEFDKHMLGENASSISGGQRQRLAIARSINRPFQLIILDEPTSALDDVNAKGILQNIIDENKDKIILFSTHNTVLLDLATVVINLEKLK